MLFDGAAVAGKRKRKGPSRTHARNVTPPPLLPLTPLLLVLLGKGEEDYTASGRPEPI